MNKVIDTSDRLFMSLVGPSGCGKTQLIFQMLEEGVFNPTFDKVIYFYQYDQPIFKTLTLNVDFIHGVDFEFIDSLPLGQKYLLIFDDSCEEICRSKSFEKLATAGRHRGLNVIYIKHNLYHKSPLGRDIELQLTHIILFKNPRDVQQVKRLSTQLGLADQLNIWYKEATKEPFGFLMIDLDPKTCEHLRFSSGFNPSLFYVRKAHQPIEIDDVQTVRTYVGYIDDFTKKRTKNGFASN